MKLLPESLLLLSMLLLPLVLTAPVDTEREEQRHFNFQTENGQQRSEDIKFLVKVNADGHTTEETPKTVEIRGDYSFISADGYEYQVFYKADEKGFHPFVTAHKVESANNKA